MKKNYTLKPWSECRVLIVNDDGIEARGVGELEALAKGVFAEVTVVAPSHEHSGMGHAISYKKTFKYRKVGEGRYAVDGTPADCTMVGVHLVMKDNPPDLVLSGINHGDNAGNAVLYSGTFGGALEAGLLGIPAIAFSQLRQEDGKTDFALSRKYFTRVLDFLRAVPWPDHVVMNVNFPPFDGHNRLHPHAAATKKYPLKRRFLTERHENGDESVLLKFDNRGFEVGGRHDLDILNAGGVTVTPVNTDWTCHETLALWSRLSDNS